MSRHVSVDAASLRRELAREPAAQGLLADARWRHAVETVPRHRFMRGFYADSGRRDEHGLTPGRTRAQRTTR